MTGAAKPAAKPAAPVAVFFRVDAATHRWLTRLARAAGDFDADACARGLIERIAAEDMAAEDMAAEAPPQEDQR